MGYTDTSAPRRAWTESTALRVQPWWAWRHNSVWINLVAKHCECSEISKALKKIEEKV